jgi:hypothetical protein
MSEIRIRVGSEDVQLCSPGDRPLPVELVEREIARSRAWQASGAGGFVENVRPPVADAIRWDGSNDVEVHAWLLSRGCAAKFWPAVGDSPRRISADDGDGGAVRGAAPLWLVDNRVDGVSALSEASFARRYSPVARPGGRGEHGHATYSREGLLRMTDEALEAQGRMVRGLARAAAAYEAGEGGSTLGGELWDDEMRSALALARELRIAPPPSPSPGSPAPGIDEAIASYYCAILACARVAYDVYRVAFVGDDPMPDFDALDPGRRLHVLRAARAAASGTTPGAFHAEWTSELARDGWTAGPELSEDAKTHPNLVPYGDLPDEQHLLDALFFAAVTATLRELGRIEAPLRAPVLNISGDVSPEQFAAFRRDWQRRRSTSACETPIVDACIQFISHVPVVKFVDDRIDSMLRRPDAWGPPLAVELQVLVLIEVREAALGSVSSDYLVTQAFHDFVVSRLGDAATAESLSEQLARLGRADEFPAIMGEFVAARRRSP